MSRPIWLCAFILWCSAFAQALAQDAPVQVAPQAGIVLLRNGQVLSGKITQAGDDYHVVLASGEIRLPASQVELVCRDLREGYERKRARLDPEKVPDHLDLALWCVRQQLFEEAAREIADARTIDQRHPRISLVERQLTLAQQKPTRILPAVTASEGPSNEDLNRLMRGMPPGTVETFSNTIQPLLLNTCGNAGCHGPQSESKLRLLRTQLGKSSSRRFTQRNLHAVMEMVDRADPPSSALLTAPVAPHGTAKSAIFTSRDVVQYRQLVQWVMRVARGSVVEQPSSVAKPEDNLLQQLPSAGKSNSQQPPANPLLVGRAETRSAAAEAAQVIEKRAPIKGSAAAADPPGDPFDPGIFNRQFSPAP